MHLKPRQEYVDRYDRMTIERCRWAEKAISGEDIQKHEKKKLTKKDKERMVGAFSRLHVWFLAGELYSKKEKTITQWMRDDEEKDQFFESAKAPKGINCLTCGREMFVTHKHMETNLDKPHRVMFMYDCTLNHIPRRAFYDNSEEWKYNSSKCPKCRTSFKQEDKTTKKKFVTISTCPKCGNREVSEIERIADKPKIDPDFEKDRARFCDEAEGQRYVGWMQTLRSINEVLEKQKEKDNNKELYDQVANIRRLKIIELEQLLAPAMEAAKYIKLQFKDPEIGRDVVVPFTVHDIASDREERASSHDLKRLINKTLIGTNWRLMSEGVHYRLGMLEGRFRAYEKEEDLVKLILGK